MWLPSPKCYSMSSGKVNVVKREFRFRLRFRLRFFGVVEINASFPYIREATLNRGASGDCGVEGKGELASGSSEVAKLKAAPGCSA